MNLSYSPFVHGVGSAPDAIPGNSSTDYVTLTDGNNVRTDQIVFNNDPQSAGYYSFTDLIDGSDVTNKVTIDDKKEFWPDFDPTVYNDILYAKQYVSEFGVPPPTLQTSTAKLWLQYMGNDIVNIAQDVRNVGSAVASAATHPFNWVLAAGVGIGILLALKSLK